MTNYFSKLTTWLRAPDNREAKAVWGATAFYFLYVVLGGVSHRVHKKVYTDWLGTFRKDVYAEFFFPAFLKYHATYRLHVIPAGLWLLTGVFNLRNQPVFAGTRRPAAGPNHWAAPARAKSALKSKAVPVYAGSQNHKLSGYVYIAASFLKGVTASLMALFSESLGASRAFLAAVGVWDVVSLAKACQYIGLLDGWLGKGPQRDAARHRRWMLRNFSVGFGP